MPDELGLRQVNLSHAGSSLDLTETPPHDSAAVGLPATVGNRRRVSDFKQSLTQPPLQFIHKLK